MFQGTGSICYIYIEVIAKTTLQRQHLVINSITVMLIESLCQISEKLVVYTMWLDKPATFHQPNRHNQTRNDCEPFAKTSSSKWTAEGKFYLCWWMFFFHPVYWFLGDTPEQLFEWSIFNSVQRSSRNIVTMKSRNCTVKDICQDFSFYCKFLIHSWCTVEPLLTDSMNNGHRPLSGHFTRYRLNFQLL